MRQLHLFPHAPPVEGDPPPLSFRRRDAVVAALLRGASPQIACKSLEIDLADFFDAVETDAEFRRRLRHVYATLAGNVSAAVYRAAIEGTPAAQALFLRTFAPPAYSDAPSTPRNEPSDDLSSLPADAIALQLAAYRAALGEVGPAA